MAQWSENGEEDEFFGNLDDEEYSDQGHSKGGLEEREIKATEEQFQNIGFLEGLEDNKDSCLQEGFESGYKETYEISMRIGKVLGSLAFASKLKSRCSSFVSNDDEKVDNDNHEQAIKQVWEFLHEINRNGSSTETLKKLIDMERDLQAIIQKQSE